MRLLVKLKDYTQFHFADEEMLMEKMHYPELADITNNAAHTKHLHTDRSRAKRRSDIQSAS